MCLCLIAVQDALFEQRSDAAWPILAAGEFDYTFTDKELDDVLGFMERQQGRGPGEPHPSPPPALAPLLGPTAHLAPLQFQVRILLILKDW